MPQPLSATDSTLGELRAGWPVVVACFVGNAVGLHALPPYTAGLFIGPMVQNLGWSRAQASAGITIVTLATAVTAPLAGLLIARWGERSLLTGSTLALALGYVALSALGGTLLVNWAIFVAMAVFGAGCTPVTFSRLIVRHFDRRRGAALGLAWLGTGLTASLAPPLLGPLIAAHGFSAGYQALAVVMLASLPIMLGLLNFPRASRASSLASAGAATPIAQAPPAILWRLLVAFACVALAIGGVVVHFVPMLTEAGFGLRSTQLAALLGVALILGRLLTGIAVDRLFAPRLAAWLVGIAALGFLALAFLPQGWTPLAAVFVGMALGSELDLIAFLNSRYFGRSADARFGALYAAFLCGVALSPLVFGLLRDRFGSFTPTELWSAALLAIAAITYAGLPRYPAPRA